MLVVVKRPHIEIRGKKIPDILVQFVKQNFKDAEVSDESEFAEETDWFKSVETSPAEMIVANRELRAWSQAELAKRLGVLPNTLCAMENGRRAVSRAMAVKLGEVFGSDPSAFFDFSRKK